MVRRNRAFFRIIGFVVLAIFAALFAFPVFMMTVFASKVSAADYIKSVPFFYGDRFLDNLLKLFQDPTFIRAIFNSIVIAVLTTTVQVICCTITGFILAKYEFCFKNVIVSIVIATMMIPAFVKLIPLYQMMIFMKWINTYLPFVVAAIANPMGIFLMKQYMELGLPDEMLDAGRMDGMNSYQLVFYIAFPVQKPAIAVLATLAFISNWNDYMTAMVMLPNKDSFTIPIVLQHMLLNMNSSGTYGELMMANLVTQLPLLLIFLFASKQIIGNILAGSIKS